MTSCWQKYDQALSKYRVFSLEGFPSSWCGLVLERPALHYKVRTFCVPLAGRVSLHDPRQFS